MARFNKNTKTNKTVNHEGAEAYKLTPELELYTLVCTTTLNPKFYEKVDSQVKRLRTLVKKVDPLFVARLAVYAREQMYLRTIPLVLTVELAKIHRGDGLISQLTTRVIQRADEITELLGYYVKANDRKGAKVLNKMSNQLKKGIANAFHKFDEYQFSKYNRKADIKLKDALFVSHAKPRSEKEAELFKKIANDTLETAYTWETQMSKAGQDGKDKKEVWTELIDSNKLGYMALLRNLRNILESGVTAEHVDKICRMLSDEKAVLKSKQLPFRFLSAYRMLKGDPHSSRYGWGIGDNKGLKGNPYVSEVLNALEKAVKTSIMNMELFDRTDTVLIASDVSGSMFSQVSDRSIVRNYDIGLLMSMLLKSKCKYVTSGFFGSDFKTVTLPSTGVLQNVDSLYKREGEVGYATNGYKVLDWALKSKTTYDKIVIFTDCQMWDTRRVGSNGKYASLWNQYKKRNPNAQLIMFDLNGYGTTPLDVNSQGVALIAGWSDKVFNVLDSIQNGKDALDLINEIVI